MIVRTGIRLLFLALLSGSAVMIAPLHIAHAQDADDEQAQADAADAAKQAEARRAARAAAPPAALPGAVSNEDVSGHANTDLNPTASLFDAINRGSLGAAKEALNRGADMEGHNVLGQTPLDMAIDLNRNDITFLLLSMRTLSDEHMAVASTTNSGVTIRNGSGHITINGNNRGGRGVVMAADRRQDQGGTPRPDIGFLGFGGS
ncbi:ankyrin repeat domain-containing protein [Gluconacetobacter tumulisoli]|uniref:Ankyrin repeat domain-containing protein n=1 Tax=Gluconacetobacter tumulisoli TaxID=1286189 RepID=A0A7W4K4R4_9PROT|nr:ankyrin repeat domain-containing protein [Gluconacetobacter tumulisoli]MBB2200238.1 ankyrin repeat domain-containing protein [Gluconacetobacter tumulisoli]